MDKSGEKAVKGKGKHPNCIAARKKNEFKKGGPVPQGGRPKGSLSLKERMAKFLELEIDVKMPNGSITSQTVLDSVCLSLMREAQKGNINAIKELFDRNFGKEPEKIIREDTELRGTVEEIKHAVELLSRHERDY